MLKINLSDAEESKNDAGGDETVIQLSDQDTNASPADDEGGGETIIQPSTTGEVPKETVVPTEAEETKTETSVAEEIVEKPAKDKKQAKPRLMQYLVALLAVSALALIYVQKDMILSLLPQKAEVAPPAPAPAAPPPEPVETLPAAVPEEPDPTFVAMNGISDVLPEGVWLSTVIINYDGSFKINGIAFAHPAMGSLLGALGSIGTVSERVIPAKSGSSETVYNFSVGGTLNGINVPEILDIIPTDGLITLVDPVLKRSKELEVKFSRTPKSGQSYGDKDLPFSLEGTYISLKNVIAELCPVNGNIRIYQIEILPATAGKPYNKIKASFSLRTISSI
ncbi:PilN domain-containing protein [Candidatus Latescibacterota bacterium]